MLAASVEDERESLMDVVLGICREAACDYSYVDFHFFIRGSWSNERLEVGAMHKMCFKKLYTTLTRVVLLSTVATFARSLTFKPLIDNNQSAKGKLAKLYASWCCFARSQVWVIASTKPRNKTASWNVNWKIDPLNCDIQTRAIEEGL